MLFHLFNINYHIVKISKRNYYHFVFNNSVAVRRFRVVHRTPKTDSRNVLLSLVFPYPPGQYKYTVPFYFYVTKKIQTHTTNHNPPITCIMAFLIIVSSCFIMQSKCFSGHSLNPILEHGRHFNPFTSIILDWSIILSG